MSAFVRACEDLWGDRGNSAAQTDYRWSFEDAAAHVAAWLDWHGSVDAVPGLRDALEVAEPYELKALNQRLGVALKLTRAGIV
jgi:hypothetical protein